MRTWYRSESNGSSPPPFAFPILRTKWYLRMRYSSRIFANDLHSESKPRLRSLRFLIIYYPQRAGCAFVILDCKDIRLNFAGSTSNIFRLRVDLASSPVNFCNQSRYVAHVRNCVVRRVRTSALTRAQTPFNIRSCDF